MTRPSWRTIAATTLALSTTLAVAGCWAVYTLSSGCDRPHPPPPRPVETVPVVVAARTLNPGVAITTADLRVVRLPPETLPLVVDPVTRKTHTVQVFRARERLIGQVPFQRILTNEIIRPERLADGYAGVGLNAVIPLGLRAFSIELPARDTVGGLLAAGTYVDVLWTNRGPPPRLETETILQAMFTLGVTPVAQAPGDRHERRYLITVLATALQVEDLAYAVEMGSPTLAARGLADLTYTRLEGVGPPRFLATPGRQPLAATPAPRRRDLASNGPHTTVSPDDTATTPEPR